MGKRKRAVTQQIMYLIKEPDGCGVNFTLSQTARGSIRAFMNRLTQWEPQQWKSHYRKGFRCVKVEVHEV